MSVLVDSDILIEVARGRNAEIIARWMDLAGSGTAVYCSPVSVAELWAGARPDEHEALRRLFGALTCCVIDEEVGARAGRFLREYRGSHGVGLGDALIAAAAVANGAELWTRGYGRYPMKEVRFFG